MEKSGWKICFVEVSYLSQFLKSYRLISKVKFRTKYKEKIGFMLLKKFLTKIYLLVYFYLLLWNSAPVVPSPTINSKLLVARTWDIRAMHCTVNDPCQRRCGSKEKNSLDSLTTKSSIPGTAWLTLRTQELGA